ncbi:MAG: hypothetical protein WA821_19275 [Anaerolineales bacterium]
MPIAPLSLTPALPVPVATPAATPVVEATPTVLPVPTDLPNVLLTAHMPTSTPTDEIIPTFLPTIALSNQVFASDINTIPVPGVFVDQLAMDDQYLYWKNAGGGNLFRYPLHSPKNAVAAIFAKTQFDKGVLAPYPGQSLLRVGDWLIFDDRQITEQTEAWVLRAMNIKTQTELNLAQDHGSGIGANLLYAFSSDGEWVAWITGDMSTDIVTAQNLQTGQRQELAHSASNSWDQVVVSAGRAIVIHRGDDGGTLFLFDLKSGQSRKLLNTTDPYSDMFGLTFAGDWIAWKKGTNGYGPTALYNLQTAKTETFPDWGVTPFLYGRWLTWEAAPEQPLRVVDLETRQSFIVAEAQPGDELTSPTIYGNIIAWCRVHDVDVNNNKMDSSIEWRTLP